MRYFKIYPQLIHFHSGKGLGKDENGISHAIKVSLKKDTAGVCINVICNCKIWIKMLCIAHAFKSCTVI